MNLYSFITHGAEPARFTTAKANLVVNGLTYKSRSMRRSSYTLDSIDTKNNITIMFPGDDDFARDFIHPTTETLQVEIALLDGSVFYRGELITISYNPNNTINMTFEPLIRIGLQTSGERRLFQPNCPYQLYSNNCQATRLNHSVRVTAVANQDVTVVYDTGSAGNALRADSLRIFPTVAGVSKRADIGKLVGGIFKKEETEWWITDVKTPQPTGSSVAFTVTLFQPVDGIEVDDRVRVSFGCARNTDDCENVHINIANYGGFPGMIRPSAFDGGLRGGA